MLNNIKNAWDNDNGTRRTNVATVNKREDVLQQRRDAHRQKFNNLTLNAIKIAVQNNNFELKATAKALRYNHNNLKGDIRKKFNITSWDELIDIITNNHSIVSIEKGSVIDVYDITTTKFHNFGIAKEVFTPHNSINENAVDFIPCNISKKSQKLIKLLHIKQ